MASHTEISRVLVLGGIIFYLRYTVLQTQNGIRYSTVFVDEPLTSVNGKPQKSVNT